MNPNDIRVLVEYRMKEAHTALADAEFLASSNRSSQSIINRAYYAMFYAVLALSQLRGQVPAKHSGVLGLFDREFAQKDIFPREMSKNLHAAFESRQASDYQVSRHVDPEDTVEILANARTFVEHVGKWLESQDPEKSSTAESGDREI